MKNTKRVAILMAVAVVFAGAALFVASLRGGKPLAEAGERVIDDAWYVVSLGGGRTGHAHTRVVEITDSSGSKTMVTASEQRMVLSRFGTTIESRTSGKAVETVAGTPISYAVEMTMSNVTTRTNITVEGDTLRIEKEVMGKTRTREEKVEEGFTFVWGGELKMREAVASPGRTVKFKTFVPDLGGIVEASVTCEGEEETTVLGVPMKLKKVRVEGLIPGVTMYDYRDDEGKTWKMTTNLAGMDFVMERAPREVALASSTTTAPDIILQTVVSSNLRLWHPRKVEAMVVKLSYSGKESDMPQLGIPGRQEVERLPDGSLLLSIVSQPPPERCTDVKASDVGTEYSSPSSLVQSDDEEIIALAREAAAGESDRSLVAQRLERWVHANITAKGFGLGFAGAKEVAQSRSGDCSEHAVLFVALARVLGIPSRLAYGLVYFEMPDGNPAFGYHMWTEVYLGRWTALDATLATGRADATHISLGTSSLSDKEGFLGIASSLVVLAGRIRIEIVKYAMSGHEVVAGQPETYSVLKDGLFHDNVLGFSCSLRGSPEVTASNPYGTESRRTVELTAGGVRIHVTATRPLGGCTTGGTLAALARKNRVLGVPRRKRGPGFDGAFVDYVPRGAEEAQEPRTTVRAGEPEAGRKCAFLAIHDGVRYVFRLEDAGAAERRVLEAAVDSLRFR